jgi:hypothetical protein
VNNAGGIEEAAPAALPLAYAGAAYADPVVMLYRIARICWLFPLAIGVASLAPYVLTRRQGWVIVGLYTLLVGGIALGVGVVCLLVFTTLLRRCAPDVREAWSLKSNRLFVRLLMNVPIAIACAAAGVALVAEFEGGGS